MATTDALGNVTRYEYDALGRVTEKISPLPLGEGEGEGPTTQYAYDSAGNLHSVTDTLGHVTTYAYDALGRLLSTTDADGDTTSYTYDADGKLLTETDALGHVTSYAYDELGRLTTITSPRPLGEGQGEGAPVTSCTYDADGDLLTTTDALGHTTTNSYDALGRLLSTTDAEGNTTRYTYDADGNLLTTTDALGHTAAYSYDALGRLLSTTDAEGNTTRYTYDADGDKLTETDPDGNMTTYNYDSLNRLTSQNQTIALDLSGGSPVTTTATTTYHYDADGNLVEKIDADGQATLFSYDALNREMGEQWYPDATDAAAGTGATNAIAYTYDADGELLTAQDNSSSYTYTYNRLGEQTSVDNQGTAGVPDVVLNSAYDADGKRTQLAATIGGTADFVNSYSYDRLNRETQVTQGASTLPGVDAVDGKLVNFTYNADGQFDTITRYASPTGTSTLVATSEYGYDDLGRLTSLAHTAADGTTTYAAYTWTYDADSQVTSFMNSATIGGTGCYSNENVASYSYDADGQLIAAQPVGAANASNSLSSSYDANGNAASLNGDVSVNNYRPRQHPALRRHLLRHLRRQRQSGPAVELDEQDHLRV